MAWKQYRMFKMRGASRLLTWLAYDDKVIGVSVKIVGSSKSNYYLSFSEKEKREFMQWKIVNETQYVSLSFFSLLKLERIAVDTP